MSRYSFEFKKYRKGQIILTIHEKYSSLNIIDEHKFYCKRTNGEYQIEVFVPNECGYTLLNYIINNNIANLKEEKDEYYGITYILSLSSKSLLQIL